MQQVCKYFWENKYYIKSISHLGCRWRDCWFDLFIPKTQKVHVFICKGNSIDSHHQSFSMKLWFNLREIAWIYLLDYNTSVNSTCYLPSLGWNEDGTIKSVLEYKGTHRLIHQTYAEGWLITKKQWQQYD